MRWSIFRTLVIAGTALYAAVTSAQDVKQVPIEGYRIAYVEAGVGAPIVLVHGGLQDYRVWNDIIPLLSSDYRVIAYSRRNHFPNDVDGYGAPDGAGDLHADDLALFLRALNLTSVHLVGHSSGAVTVLFFAAKYPDLTRSILLNEPPAAGLLAAAPDGVKILKEFGGRLAAPRQAFQAGELDKAVPMFVDAVGGSGAFERRSPLAKQMGFDNALAHVADNISKRPRAPFGCDEAKKISAPVFLTNGVSSPQFFHRIVGELANCLQRVERAIIPSASHNVPSENMSEFVAAIRRFTPKI